MPDTALARVLSSDERWKILDLLMTKRLSAPQISRALGVGVRSIRAHLTELVSAHLVDVFHEKLPSGKQAVVYGTAASARTLGFPPRKYENLSEALIMGLVSSLGEKSARLVLHDIGLKLGEQMGQSLLVNTDSPVLTMKDYGELVVKRFLSTQDTYPRILSEKSTEIVYEEFNCPFQELATKMPGLMCDVLDAAVHEGLDRALSVKTTRLGCRGHGDVACRFSVVPRVQAAGGSGARVL